MTSPWRATRDFPPLYRYADNLCYLTGSVAEGHLALDRVRRLLASAGTRPQGRRRRHRSTCARAGVPVCWASGSRCTKTDCAWTWEKTPWNRTWPFAWSQPTTTPTPPRGRTALRGWVASYGPALGDLTEPTGGDPLHRSTARVPRAGLTGGTFGLVHGVLDTMEGPLHGGPDAPGTDGRGLSLRGGSASHRSTGRLITRSTPEAGCPGNAWGTRLLSSLTRLDIDGSLD